MNFASTYDTDNRAILVRYNGETDSWHWAHPADGSVHGTNVDSYVTFDSESEAITTAVEHGYTVVRD